MYFPAVDISFGTGGTAITTPALGPRLCLRPEGMPLITPPLGRRLRLRSGILLVEVPCLPRCPVAGVLVPFLGLDVARVGRTEAGG
jgi:hypothetical protein